MFLQKLARFFSSDIGIDLGTANCLVFLKGQGIVLSEPSVVAIREKDNEPLAVGEDAKKIMGRNPKGIKVIRPMKVGVIADLRITEYMIRAFIQKAKLQMPSHCRLIKPRVLIAVPYGITPVETGAVRDCAEKAGASESYLVEEPLAAAIGVGLPVSEPTGSMIVDIGGGTTEVAVISYSDIVIAKSEDVGGDTMDQAIVQHMKRVYNLTIGERTAEEIKIRIGSAYPDEEQDTTTEVKGLDLVSGLPKAINVTSKEIRTAIQDPVMSIVLAVRSTLEKCPPELASDLIDHGIVLAGGGALLRGLARLISEETGLFVAVAEDPLLAVAKGTGKMLPRLDELTNY
ncbi:MAG: rod shape-determining protein [Lentisphaeria bacterium]|nr:rod shape-determining protein [Lentisphaeria bacterium]